MDNKNSNNIWNKYYTDYDINSDIPGVKYPNEHLVRFMTQIKKELCPNENKRLKVLEFGFGNITNMTMMSELGFEVVGLEVSENTVERAKKALKKRNLKTNVTVQTYQGGTIPFEDNEFDIIVGLQCVYYNLDQLKFAQECNRVLKNDGLLFLSFFSRRHGYMNYIEELGNDLVKFSHDHPHSRLIDLKLYLYNDRQHFNDIYGKFFDINVGLYETDQLPIFQSWYYLRGQQKDSNNKIKFPISFKEKNKIEEKTDYLTAEEKIENNINIWEKYHDKLPKNTLFNNQKYPNEESIRFLATFKRRQLNNYFEARTGQEDSIDKVDKLKALEINFLNPTHLLAMKNFNYIPFGVTTSKSANEETQKALEVLDKEKEINTKIWDGKKLPYDDNLFNTIISHKFAYNTPEQNQFIDETARVLKKDGEVFMWYLSEDHGYLKYCNKIDHNLYQFGENHPNKNLSGLYVYIANKDELEKQWSTKFSTNIKYFEFDMYNTFSSFYLVHGIKK